MLEKFQCLKVYNNGKFPTMEKFQHGKNSNVGKIPMSEKYKVVIVIFND